MLTFPFGLINSARIPVKVNFDDIYSTSAKAFRVKAFKLRRLVL